MSQVGIGGFTAFEELKAVLSSLVNGGTSGPRMAGIALVSTHCRRLRPIDCLALGC